jgi:acetolactate synthase-1/2/3 large subunit
MGDLRKTSVAQAVVEALTEEKVEFVFGLAGSHVLAIFDALADVPDIRHVVVKHESSAAFMAGMYGYLTGRPGVVLVTAGPAATNSITGVAQAYNQSVPMVHISGDVPTGSGNAAFHGVDREDFLHRMFADITKWSVRVERAEQIPGILSRAFALAASGRPGPVHIDIPVDIVRGEKTEIPRYRLSPPEKQSPREDLITQTREALAEARRPLICAGRGVLVHRAESELAALAEALTAPVLSTTDAIGVIPADHPLAVGAFSEWRENRFAMELLAESDVLLSVGLRSDTPTTHVLAQNAPRHAIFVAFDEPHTLRPMEGMTRVEASDSKQFLSALLAHLDEFQRPVDSALQARIAEHSQAFEIGLARHMAPFKDVKPLHFGHVVQTLVAGLEKNAIQDALIVGGIGNHAIWGETFVPVENRESFIAEGSWGTMGGELAGGIAAKLVYPQRQVIVITGDGSLLMGSSDFVTAVEAGANILVVVLNDSRYGMITALQEMRFGRPFGDEIGWIDFARFAESFGAAGLRVESPELLPDAVARSLALSAETPVILDAVCDHEYRWPNRDDILALGLKERA